VEKVVYPPRKPVIRNNFHLPFIENQSKKFIKKPINNAPIQLTKRVTTGELNIQE
jgi:hypothetical protein